MSTSQLVRAGVMQQVARLAPVDRGVLARVRDEVRAAEPAWVSGYEEHQSGGWWTISLLNDTGEPTDVTIRDCAPVATSLLTRLPATTELLRGLGLRYMWARIARLERDAFLWEHRDYDELEQTERYRLHIPLETNRSAFLVIGGVKVWLSGGSIWRLTPTFAHGVCNLAGPDRVHLVLDCYPDAAFHALAGAPNLDESDVEVLPRASAEELAGHLAAAERTARTGDRAAAERDLLRLFYRYTMDEGQPYDLIAALYSRLGEPAVAGQWLAKKLEMLGAPQAV